MSRLGGASPSLAQLYASIAASESTHVSVLERAGRRLMAAADADIAALQGALAAEHAAVYGYGVAGAMLSGADQADTRRPTGTRIRSPGTTW